MPLIKDGQITLDSWKRLAGDEDVPASGDVIAGLEHWQAARDELLTRPGRLGIYLRPDQPPRLIADDLSHFDLVALEFPSFKDGRAYSHARVLRQRYGFRGEVRATGEVLRDQLMFMVRCGFDAFELADGGGNSDSVWREAMNELTVFYQAASDGRRPAWELRHTARAAAE